MKGESMEEKRKCINCMSDMQPGEIVCRKCGFDSRNIDQPIYALPCNFLLHGRYIIGKVLGQGGFGITYVAWDRLLDVKVAVKEYFPMGMVTRDAGTSSSLLWSTTQSDTAERRKGYDNFLKEARKMAKIDNIPSIVRVRDIFLENETAYIIMDFVEGTTLKEMLLKDGVMPFERCMHLLRPMMEGLARVHNQKIVHRDISPDNIMIQKDGSVMLLDLGAAKDMTDAKGQKSQLVAKKGFSPLEQYVENKAIGPWTDVYALCATIYYCITGKVLRTALERLDDEEIEFPPEMDEKIPDSVKKVLRAGLTVKPEERIQSVDELLRRFDGEEEADEVEETEREPGKTEADAKADLQSDKSKKKNNGFIIPAAVIGVLGVIVILVFVLTASSDPFRYKEYSDYVVLERYAGKDASVVIPSEKDGRPVTEIGSKAFENRTNLTSVSIPRSVTEIGSDAFRGCTELTNIEISDGVTKIEMGAFRDCTSLTSVSIPDSVTEIQYGAFQGCISLTNIVMSENVTEFEGYVFSDCTSISNVKIPYGITEIGGGAFKGCTDLKELTIPKGVRIIGSSAFSGCTGLTDVIIPDSVRTMGSSVFQGCTNMKSIKLSENIIKIETFAFDGCSNLQNIEIPDGVIEIGDYAFDNCINLKSITLPEDTLVSDTAFDEGITINNR